MLGGSEFRLRQGFAFGKTLVTRHLARLSSDGRTCGGNRNELRTSHTRKGVEAGSNSPVDCCVSENRFPLHIAASMAAICSPAKVLPSAKHL